MIQKNSILFLDLLFKLVTEIYRYAGRVHIERLWKDLHDNVKCNHRCAGMEKLTSEVRLYFKARN
jgi:hypothetical protein